MRSAARKGTTHNDIMRKTATLIRNRRPDMSSPGFPAKGALDASPPAVARDAGAMIAWASNVVVSVGTVFLNKFLLGTFNFGYPTSLTAMHFTACALATRMYKGKKTEGAPEGRAVPHSVIFLFMLVANTSIVSLNASLMVNTVSVYQIAKLLIVPAVCVLERLIWGTKQSNMRLAAIVIVVLGVAMFTLQDTLDVTTTSLGGLLATLSVATSAMQQVMVRGLQQKYDMSPQQLLGRTAPVQAICLALVGPWLDFQLSDSWILAVTLTPQLAAILCVSCSVAVLVNYSQYACLGKFSAVSFQVLGHTKTVLVLVGSATLFHETMASRQVAGMMLAVVGMVTYSLQSK